MSRSYTRAFAAALAAAALFAMAHSTHAQEAKKEASKEQRAKPAAKKGALNEKDAKYMRDMAQGDLAEVQAGKLAATKGSSADVKKFAQHMVDDHGKKLGEARELAKSKGMQLPAAPAKKHQDAMKKLESASGAAFDKAYLAQMVKDHDEALKLVQEAAKNATDKDLKAAAEKSIPVVQKHLEMAKSLAASVK